jgi:hypothetical protein
VPAERPRSLVSCLLARLGRFDVAVPQLVMSSGPDISATRSRRSTHAAKVLPPDREVRPGCSMYFSGAALS